MAHAKTFVLGEHEYTIAYNLRVLRLFREATGKDFVQLLWDASQFSDGDDKDTLPVSSEHLTGLMWALLQSHAGNPALSLEDMEGAVGPEELTAFMPIAGQLIAEHAKGNPTLSAWLHARGINPADLIPSTS